MTSAPVATGSDPRGRPRRTITLLGGRGDVEDLVDHCRNPEGYGEKQHHPHEEDGHRRG
jgi:hypothetical protein